MERVAIDQLEVTLGLFVKTPICYLPVEIQLPQGQGKLNLDLDSSWLSNRGLDVEVGTEAIRAAFERNDWLLDSIFIDDEWHVNGYYRYIISKRNHEVHLTTRPRAEELESELNS